MKDAMGYLGALAPAGALPLGLLLLGACTTGQSPPPAAAANAQVVCATERSIGSHMPRHTCRTRAQMEAERTAARDTIDRIRTLPSVTPERQ